MKEELQLLFFERYKRNADLVVQAPTRINLIGEHTDYNGGLVLPAAIDFYIYFAVAKSATPIAFIEDENKHEQFAFELDEDIDFKALSQWRKYFYGTVKILQESHDIGGFQLVKLGKAPIGAGISSSAALCSGLVFALNELFHLGLTKWDMAFIGQRVEQEYVGLNCGIMDQFAVLFGEERTFLKLDCFTHSFSRHQVDFGHYELLIVNSMVKHNLAESAYNERVAELKGLIVEGVIQQNENLSPSTKRRLKHIASENKRVVDIITFLEKGHYEDAGDLLLASHKSLQEDYEVTCLETDFLVEGLMEVGALGARQMGGGFGGCVLALVPSEAIPSIENQLSERYIERFNLVLEYHEFNIVDGVKLI